MVDYKDVLSAEDFQIYAELRELRKALAAQAGVPPYALFTNEQLANMVQQRITSKSALLSLNGVGKARVDKYGDAFLAKLCATLGPLT